MFYYSVISGPVNTKGYLRFILSKNQNSLEGPNRRVIACEYDLSNHKDLKIRVMTEAVDVYFDDHEIPFDYAASGDIGDNIELVVTDPCCLPPR